MGHRSDRPFDVSTAAPRETADGRGYELNKKRSIIGSSRVLALVRVLGVTRLHIWMSIDQHPTSQVTN